MIGRTNSMKNLSRFPNTTFTYTGECYSRQIRYQDKNYLIIEIVSSGILEFSEEVVADVCSIGGGAAGMTGPNYSTNGAGGAGGYVENCFSQKFLGADIIIGAGGITSYVTSSVAGGLTQVVLSNRAIVGYKVATGGGGSGGSGGGSSYIGGSSLGQGRSTYIFEDSSVYEYPIAAGGAGGSKQVAGSGSSLELNVKGGIGGSDGADGFIGTSHVQSGAISRSLGGYFGGGDGGGASSTESIRQGLDGVTYGSGGGGNGSYYSTSSGGYLGGAGGQGYQGAVFIRIRV